MTPLQLDLFALEPVAPVAAPPPPAPREPLPRPEAHVPGRWYEATIGYRLVVATCLRCGQMLFRPKDLPDAQLMRYDAYRGGLTSAGICEPIPREYWGPRPGRESSW